MKVQGIYMLRCSKTKKVYIGSSVDIYKRFNDHTRLLDLGKHHSYKLQSHWNRIYKINLNSLDPNICLELYILEECKIEDMSALELCYIKLYNSVKKGFNVSYDTSRSKPKKKKVKLTEEEYLLQHRYKDFM